MAPGRKPKTRERPLDPATAYAAALRRLARRDHSLAELRRALGRAGHDDAVVEAVLDRLARAGYLSDGRFAEAFARSRLTHHGLGRHRIRQDLLRRGVGRPDLENALQRALADAPEGAAIDALARRFWARRSRDEPPLRLRKLWAFLVRRGFPPALVHERLHALWPRWADALAGLEPWEGP